MKIYDRVSIDQWFLAAVGSVLLLGSVMAMGHGARATMAVWLSYSAQKESAQTDVEGLLKSCARAYALYPWNYYFSIFAAEAAYYRADEVRGEARAERLRQSRLWCDRGLAQNPYRSQLRRLETRFLWEESPLKAIAYWEAYTEWQFWNAYNHATLAELYAKAGEFAKAEAELKWVERDASYAETKRCVEREKKLWDDALNGKVGNWGE